LDDALALLRLLLEWGADEALEPEPANRLHPVEPSLQVARPPLRPLVAPLGVPPLGVPPLGVAPLGVAPLGVATLAAATLAADQPRLTPAHRAVALAGQAANLNELRDTLASFDGCALRDTASNLVFAEGDAASTTLIIGEPPGREEDRSGHPFAGPDGVLLDQMLASIGLDRRRLMLTPLLPWRPPGGRPPNAVELAICLPFLHRLIVLLDVSRLVLFGGSAGRALLSPAQTRRRQVPGWVDCRIPELQKTLPSILLPSLGEMQKTLPLRRVAWAGLRLLRRAVDQERSKCD
jgi:uracil-DNA glycosylase